MNINLTLIGQSITFAVFVWFCYAYVWPPLVNALTERKKKIADGLAAAERGQHEQFRGNERVAALLRELVAQIEVAAQIAGDLHVAAAALNLRQAIQRIAKKLK